MPAGMTPGRNGRPGMGRSSLGRAAALLCLLLPPVPAGAQAIDGLAVGAPLHPAASLPPPAQTSQTGDDDATAWELQHGNGRSVVVSARTGRVVYLESHWGGPGADPATQLPGLTFGTTTLDDVRARFGSNGFGFKSNAVQLHAGRVLASTNCYGLAGTDTVLCLGTILVPGPDLDPNAPQLGHGLLVAVILGTEAYLRGRWGDGRLFDPGYHPVRLDPGPPP